MFRYFVFALTMITLAGCGGNANVVDTDEFSFETVNYPGADFTEMLTVNNVGQALGRYKLNNYADYENDPWVLFIYDMQTKSFTPVPIAGLSAQSNTVRGIDLNDVGQLVMTNSGGVFYDINTERLVTTDPWVTPTDTRFISINNAGQIVGWHFSELTGVNHYKIGFLYDIENMEMIYANYPGARNTQFFGINDAGMVVAKYTLPDETSAIVLYDSVNGTFTDLNIPTDTSEWDITDINNDGVIIASTENSCTITESQQGKCFSTIHRYNVITTDYTTNAMPYNVTGYSNEALNYAGTVNQDINIFTGEGKSTGLLATTK